MGDTAAFAVLVLITAVVGLLAVLSNRFSERVHIPAPALFLAAAAIAIQLFRTCTPHRNNSSNAW